MWDDLTEMERRVMVNALRAHRLAAQLNQENVVNYLYDGDRTTALRTVNRLLRKLGAE